MSANISSPAHGIHLQPIRVARLCKKGRPIFKVPNRRGPSLTLPTWRRANTSARPRFKDWSKTVDDEPGIKPQTDGACQTAVTAIKRRRRRRARAECARSLKGRINSHICSMNRSVADAAPSISFFFFTPPSRRHSHHIGS